MDVANKNADKTPDDDRNVRKPRVINAYVTALTLIAFEMCVFYDYRHMIFAMFHVMLAAHILLFIFIPVLDVALCYLIQYCFDR